MITFPYRGMALSHRPPLGDCDNGDDDTASIGLTVCRAWLCSEHFTRVLTHTILTTALTAGTTTYSCVTEVRPREVR